MSFSLSRLPAPATGSGSNSSSALGDFLSQTVDYEASGAPMPKRLIAYGVIGGVLTMLVGLAGFAIPPASRPRALHDLPATGDVAADLGGLLHSMALPVVCLGVLLTATGVMLAYARSLDSRHLMTAQLTAGAIVPAVATILIVLIAIAVLLIALLVAAFIGTIGFGLWAWADSL